MEDAAAVHGGDCFHKFAENVADHTKISESGGRVDAKTATPVMDPLGKIDPTLDKLLYYADCPAYRSVLSIEHFCIHEQVVHLGYVFVRKFLKRNLFHKL